MSSQCICGNVGNVFHFLVTLVQKRVSLLVLYAITLNIIAHTAALHPPSPKHYWPVTPLFKHSWRRNKLSRQGMHTQVHSVMVIRGKEQRKNGIVGIFKTATFVHLQQSGASPVFSFKHIVQVNKYLEAQSKKPRSKDSLWITKTQYIYR